MDMDCACFGPTTELDALIVRLSASDGYTVADLMRDQGLFEKAFGRLERLAAERGYDAARIEELRSAKDEMIARFEQFRAQPDAITTVAEEALFKALKDQATSLFAEGTMRAPEYLGPAGGERLEVSSGEDGSYSVSYGGSEVGVIASNGSTVSGSPELGELVFRQRCLEAMAEEPAYQNMADDDKGRVQSAVNRTAQAMLVTGRGCGATYLGADGNGRGIIVTAAHCDWDKSDVVTFRTVWGRPIRAEKMFRTKPEEDGTEDEVWQTGGDIGIYIAAAEDSVWLAENVAPVQIAEAPPATESMVVAMSPFWQEAELMMIDKTTTAREPSPTDPSAGTEIRVLNMERLRPGYSGSCVMDLNGNLVGIASNGGYDDLSGMHVGELTSFEQLRRVMDWIGVGAKRTQVDHSWAA
jgi:hypothetical protein